MPGVIQGENQPEVRTCKYCFEVMHVPEARKSWMDPSTGVIHLVAVKYHKECLIKLLMEEVEVKVAPPLT